MIVIKYQLWDKDAEVMREVLEIDFEHNYAMCKEGKDKFHYDLDVYNMRQYTGLKDKNGKEIYEGDIIVVDKAVSPSTESYRGCVTYIANVDGCAGYDLVKANGERRIFGRRMEVIGNIYANPELLAAMDS